MSDNPAGKVLAALLTVAACGLVWAAWRGPSGQLDANPLVTPRMLLGTSEAAPAGGALPRATLENMPVKPFNGFGKIFTDNLAEPFRYLGPGREMDDDWDKDVVKLGMVAQLSGPAGAYGRMMLRGTQMAVEEANAAGGYQGKPFQLVSSDDFFDMGVNGNRTVDMIFKDKVRAIVGAVHSGNTHVGIRVALKCEIPQITSVSTDPTITDVMIPFAFRCLADDRLQGRALAAYMFGVKDYRRIVLVNQLSRYGLMGIGEIRTLARRLGREVLLQMQFNSGQKDFSALADRMARLKPDAMVVWGLYYESARLVKALRDRGITVPILGGDGLVSPEFIAQAGPAAEGTVVTYPFDAERDDPRTKDFLERYRKKFGGEADSFVAHAYDSTRIVVEAIRSAGLNRARIRDAMAATKNFPGVTGPISFDGTGNFMGEVKLAVVEGGKFKKLENAGSGLP